MTMEASAVDSSRDYADLQNHVLHGRLEGFRTLFESITNKLEILRTYNENRETLLSLAIKSKKFDIALYLIKQLNDEENNDQLDRINSISSEELDEFIQFPGLENIRHLLYHKASELKRNRHGGDFQLKLLMLFAYKSYKSNFDFRLGTEVNEADKFDDLVLRYKDSTSDNGFKYRFLQAKHTQHLKKENNIHLNDLLGKSPKGDYNLNKYFDSYCTIKEKTFKGAIIEDLILCTNNKFAADVENFITEIKQKGNKYTFISNVGGKLYLFNSNLKTKLKMKEQDELKLDEFLRKLVFAVELPSSLLLNKKIKDMMGSNTYNFIHFATFQEKMNEWFANRETDNTARFVFSSEIKNFFSNLKNKIAAIELNGLVSLFEKDIKQFSQHKLEFKSEGQDMKILKNFLDSHDDRILILVYEEKDSLLSIAKVYQILKNKHQEEDTYSISDLESLSSLNENDRKVVSAFESENKNLLVIQCNYINENGKNLIEELVKIVEEVSKKNKKIIFVLNNNKIHELPDSLHKYIESYKYMKNDLDSFTLKSKNTILEKIKISLFGQERTLKCLTKNNGNDLFLNGEALTILINDDGNIKIGKKQEYDFDTYIDVPRTFTYQTKISIDCLKEINREVFVLLCTTTLLLELKSILGEENVKECEEKEFEGEISDRFRIYTISDLENFEKLGRECKKDTRNIHFLEYKGKNSPLEWKQSRGSLINLRRYLQITENEQTMKITELINLRRYLQIPENEQTMKITELTNSAIIAGDPGMGKSTLMTTFSLNPNSLWPIKINLKRDEEHIQTANFDDLNGVVTFLSNVIGPESSQTPLISNLLRHSLMQENQVTLLLDGYDEIKSHNQVKIVKLLKTLKTTLGKVFITTRLHERSELEDALGIFAYTLNCFNEEEQKNFLNKFWAQKLNVQDLDSKENINKFTDQLLNYLLTLDLMKKENIVGIVLQARMVAEIFQEKCKEYVQNRAFDIDTFGISNIFDLYDKFIERQYERYLKEKVQISTTLSKNLRNALTRFCTKAHSYLALKSLFSEDQTQGLLPEKILLKEELMVIGLIIFLKEDSTAVFLHPTYAEYFVADFLVNVLRKEKEHPKFKAVNRFFRTQIFKNRNQVIRKFVNDKIEKENDSDLSSKWNAIQDSDLLKKVSIAVKLQLKKNVLDPLYKKNLEDLEQEYIERKNKLHECWDNPENDEEMDRFYKNASLRMAKEHDKNYRLKNLFPSNLNQENWNKKYKLIDTVIWNFLHHAEKERFYKQCEEQYHYISSQEDLKNLYYEKDYKTLAHFLVPSSISRLEDLIELNHFHRLFPYIISQDAISEVKSFITSDEKSCKFFVQRIIKLLRDKIDWCYLGSLDNELDRGKELKHLQSFFFDILYNTKVNSFAESCVKDTYNNKESDTKWLERNGVLISRVLEILTPEMSKTFNSILDGKLDGFKIVYSNGVFYDLIIYFVNKMADRAELPKVDKLALLQMLVRFVKFFVETKKQLSITTVQLKGTLELVKNILNDRKPDSVAESLEYLYLIGKQGLKVIDAEEEILVLDPSSEFEYRYQFSTDYVTMLTELIKVVRRVWLDV